MRKDDLDKRHPDYDLLIEEWRFFIRSYFGGKFYKDGNYLIQHPFESTMNYNRRRESSYYYNYCAPIVDIFVSHLFRKAAVRDFGSLREDPLFAGFLKDADMDGCSFIQCMREAQRLASIYGRVSIVVDKPSYHTSTLAEARALGVYPYIGIITPESLIDWSFTRLESGKEVLESVKIREERGRYRIWTRESWEIWQTDEDSQEVALVDAGEHDLGCVPIVNLYNKRSGTKMVGISDIQDISDINKNIYYLCSDAKEIIENTAFPMIAMPYERGSGSSDREIGPRNILQFDPAEPNSKPYWLEAPHSSLSEIREWVNQDITEIHRIAKMGGVKATEDFSRAASGIALELEYQQLHSTLSEKADNLEQAESQVLKLWARWQGGDFDGVIDYPDDFSVRDIDRDLDRAIKARGVDVKSDTFKAELDKRIVRLSVPKLSDDARTRIECEIEGGGDDRLPQG